MAGAMDTGAGVNHEGFAVILGRLLVPAKMALAEHARQAENELAARKRQKEEGSADE